MSFLLVDEFKYLYGQEDGYGLAAIFTPVAPETDPNRLVAFYRSSNAMHVSNELRSALIYHSGGLSLSKEEASAWVEVFASYWSAIGEILLCEEMIGQGQADFANWNKAYESWRGVTTLLQRYFNRSLFPYWAIPCLYTAGKYLRLLAIKADDASRERSGNVAYSGGFDDEDIVKSVRKMEKLEDAARVMNSVFGSCANDRAPIEQSRKWGIYNMANLCFKIYFQLNSLNLCKSLIRSVSVTELPPLNQYPLSHQVTFNYYSGVMSFIEEDYSKAEEFLKEAFEKCHPQATKNQELILTYLIPCHILTSHQLPTPQLLAPFPQLASLFLPLAAAIKHASLAEFDAALQAGEPYFVKRRIYLTLERARDIALRNLLRKVFVTGGYEPLLEGQTEADRKRRTRIPITEFVAAVRLSSKASNSGETIDRDEVECLLANMMYKDLMKGYIHRERGIVVLSKNQPFPGTKT
ncbi:hypothetical protein BT63DRAFT_471951 [Microthyrium microscopicum]|uniref:Protein CSN12 homolog n=1 Tax=Microthyrium microscopicum TaxID=703497 RepID=A0A6A6UB34_9PEZI|nr:hypothetical protein BT63DRAFT_471951 [Microthyrium microscopicum]